MKLLAGKDLADEILSFVKEKIEAENLHPSLAVILVGSDPASEIYVNLKGQAAEKIGIEFQLIRFAAHASEDEILTKIIELNANEETSGIIVQLPLPEKLNTQKIIDAIASKKDVDGFSSAELEPVFPQAILKLLKSSCENLADRKAVVVANSAKFGEVMVAVLAKKNIAGKYILSQDLQNDSLKKADIVITACGVPGKITGEMIKTGAIVIDGGITKQENKTLGDVDFESVSQVASFLTPVPGGVGPVTIACLLENVYLAAKRAKT